MWFLAFFAIVISEAVVVIAASDGSAGDDSGAGAS
jgi:hypothetical protein